MKYKVACRGCGELFMPSFHHRVYCNDEHKALAELLDGEETKHQATVGRVLKLPGADIALVEDLARHLPHPQPMFHNNPPQAPQAVEWPHARFDAMNAAMIRQARDFRRPLLDAPMPAPENPHVQPFVDPLDPVFDWDIDEGP